MTSSFNTLARIATLSTLAVALLGATAVIAQTTTDSAGLLRDAAGKTLYTFDKDSANESRCFDGCAVAWPPFMAEEGAKAQGKLAPIARKGGGLQWALDGKPLYFFAGDAKPGDTAGDGQGGVWHVVKTGESSSKPKRAVAPADSGYGGYGSGRTY